MTGVSANDGTGVSANETAGYFGFRLIGRRSLRVKESSESLSPSESPPSLSLMSDMPSV